MSRGDDTTKLPKGWKVVSGDKPPEHETPPYERSDRVKYNNEVWIVDACLPIGGKWHLFLRKLEDVLKGRDGVKIRNLDADEVRPASELKISGGE